MESIIRILTYNVMIPVLKPIRYYGQEERARKLFESIAHIQDLDIVILNELIPSSIEKIVTEEAKKHGFIYKTHPLTNIITVNGGIIVFSKHEIIQQDFTIFGDYCVGSDCLAAKGILYARIMKHHVAYNIFAIHMQAWTNMKDQLVKENQIIHLNEYMNSFDIPTNEPVLVVGDFNIDMYVAKDHLIHLMKRLNIDYPDIHPESHMFTIDAEKNILVGSDDISMYKSEDFPKGCKEEYYEHLSCPCCPSEWIDYIFYSKKFLQPIKKSSFMKSIVIHSKEPFEMNIRKTQKIMSRDISDHYPVYAQLVFPNKSNNVETKNQHSLGFRKKIEKKNAVSEKNISVISITLLLGLVFMTMIIVLITNTILKIKARRNILNS